MTTTLRRRITHEAIHGADVAGGGNLERQSEGASLSKTQAKGEPRPLPSWDDGEETIHDASLASWGAEGHNDDLRDMLHQIVETSHSPKIFVEFLPSCTRHTVEVIAPQEIAGQEPKQVVDQLLSLKDSQRNLSFGIRLPSAPDGEQGKLVVGGMVLDIDAIGGESATLGVPAVKLVKWLSASQQRSHESVGWIDVSSWAPAKRSGLMLVAVIAVWFLVFMLISVHHGRGLSEGVGVQSLARNVLEAQLERNLAGIPVTHDNPMYEQYHHYYLHEYQRLVAQAETAAARRETILRFYGASIDWQVLRKTATQGIAALLLLIFLYFLAKVCCALVGGVSGQDSNSKVETICGLLQTLFHGRSASDDDAGSQEEHHESSKSSGVEEHMDVSLQSSDSMGNRQSLEPTMLSRGAEEPIVEIEQLSRDSFQEEPWTHAPHDALSDSKNEQESQLRPAPVGTDGENGLPLVIEGPHGQPVLANWAMSQRSLLLEGAAERPPAPPPRIDYGASPQRQKLQRKIAARERGQQNSGVGGPHLPVSGTSTLKSAGGVGDVASATSLSMHGSSTCKDDPLCDETAVEALLRELEDTPKVSKKKRHALQRQPTQGQRGAKSGASVSGAVRCSNGRAQPESVATVNLKSSQPQPHSQLQLQPPQLQPQQQQQQQVGRSRVVERAAERTAEPAAEHGRVAGRPSGRAAGQDLMQKLKMEVRAESALTARSKPVAAETAPQGKAIATVADVESETCDGTWDIALRRRAKRRTSAAPEIGTNDNAANIVSVPSSIPSAATKNSHSMEATSAVSPPQSPLMTQPDTASALLPPSTHNEGGRLGGCRSKAAAGSKAHTTKSTSVASGATPTVEAPSQPVWVTAAVVPKMKEGNTGDVEAANAVLEELQQMRKDELLRWFNANQALEWLSDRLSGAQEMECTPRSVLLEHAAFLLGATSCNSSSSSSGSSSHCHNYGFQIWLNGAVSRHNQEKRWKQAAIALFCLWCPSCR